MFFHNLRGGHMRGKTPVVRRRGRQTCSWEHDMPRITLARSCPSRSARNQYGRVADSDPRGTDGDKENQLMTLRKP